MSLFHHHSEEERHPTDLNICRLYYRFSFKHILISLTSFIGIPNSMRILYNTSLLVESYTFSESINN
jgi:hypothetical protein